MAERSRVHIVRWVSFERLENGVRFDAETGDGDPAQIEVTLTGPAIARLRMAPGRLTAPAERLLVRRSEPPTGATLGADQEGLTLATPHLKLRMTREPWQFTVQDPNGEAVVTQAIDDRDLLGTFEVSPLGWEKGSGGEPVRIFDALQLAPDERFFGFGERFVPLDQRGRRWQSWTTDALSTATQRAYKPIPFGMSSRGYGLFINSTARIDFDLGASSSLSAAFCLDQSELDYFIIYGPALSDVLRRYWGLTGAPPVPPLWSFGFWSSRFGYQNRQEVEEVARGYRERGIPCDVIHLDPQWMGPQENWCNLAWDTTLFPDPSGMIDVLQKEGFRICLWVNPYVPQGSQLFDEGAGQGFFVQDGEEQPYLIPGWTEKKVPLAVVDFTNPDAVAWWREKHQALLDMGVATFKTDFGEWAPADGHYHDGTPGPLAHNLYPLLYNRAVFETLYDHTSGQALVWARSATAGSQRYPVHWGGDSRTTFRHMASSLRGGLNFILSGFAYWSHDIGGFWGESDPSLYARWAQFGLFSSHARAHGTTPREPWLFGAETEAIFRKYVTLRYRLLPYIYSCAAQTAATGRPLLRPLLLDFQEDPTTHTLDLQYMFGDAILVAPVFGDDLPISVYLPQGRWVDYWSSQIYAGPTWIALRPSLDTLPLFVREGAIIPMGPQIDHVDGSSLDPLTLDIYPAGDGAFSLLDPRVPPAELYYHLDREGLSLHIDGYSGQVEALLNLVPAPWDVRVNGRRSDDWEADERHVRVRFSADGPTELSLKFDL